MKSGTLVAQYATLTPSRQEIVRKYPGSLTPMQRRMMRQIEVDPFYVGNSKREEVRIETLKKKGFLRRRARGGLEVAGLVQTLTCFVQEGAKGPVKICRAAVTRRSKLKAALGKMEKLQIGNPRALRLLGYFEEDRMKEFRETFREHRMNPHDWFDPAPEVLAATKHQAFEKA